MKQPDRFEMMPDSVGILQEDDAFTHKAVLGLLRKQHAAYVRMVKRLKLDATLKSERDWWYETALNNVLASMERYRKGGTP